MPGDFSKNDVFAFSSFLKRFAGYKGGEELLSLEDEEGVLQALGEVGKDGVRKDLPAGHVFLYRFPLQKLSHVGGFSRYAPSGLYKRLWIFVGDGKILFADNASDLERSLGGDTDPLLPGEAGYLQEGQEDAIEKAQEYLLMSLGEEVKIDGVVWRKRASAREIALLELESREINSHYFFSPATKECAIWVSSLGSKTSEQLAGLKRENGESVPDHFSLEKHFSPRAEKISGASFS